MIEKLTLIAGSALFAVATVLGFAQPAGAVAPKTASQGEENR